MVIATITERGILSKNNSINLEENVNNTDFNLFSGTAVSATRDSITLEEGGVFTGKVIELINGLGENQSRLITEINDDIATISPSWDIIPNNTTKYIIHQHSGACPLQTHDSTRLCVMISSDSPNIDDYFTGSYVKFLHGNGADQIREIEDYKGDVRKICLTEKIKISPLEGTLYAIYGEGGMVASSSVNTIVLDGNQSPAVKINQYIELIQGTGIGQIRRIINLVGNIATVNKNWNVVPDTSTRYTIFGGWSSENGFESVLRHAIVTVASTVNINGGERAILILDSSMDTNGRAELRDISEMSYKSPNLAHAITVISEFFRLKIISMGTKLNGTIQTILNSYKSGKVTSKMESELHAYSDCELNRSIIAGKTPGGRYQNINADYLGNLSISIKNPIDAFGSISTTQPRQFAEVMFLHDNLNPYVVQTELLNSGSVSVENNIAIINSGAHISGSACLHSIRRMRYTPGLAVMIRFVALFSEPIADSVQIVGYGDCCDGIFIGYNGLDFGILFRRGGKNEIRRLTITSSPSIDENITVTLNGITSSGISILTTDSIQQITKKIAASNIFSSMGDGWLVHEESSSVLFISKSAESLNGTYSVNSTEGTAGNFVTIQNGSSPTDNWIKQKNWNIDQAIGNYDLPVICPQKGNVYEIGLQWLGFGNITIKMEHPELGTFFNLHQIKYSNLNTITSLVNPNLYLYAYVNKTGNNSTDSVFIKTSSMGSFTMGDNNKNLGPRLGLGINYNTTSGALTSGVYYNICTLRNMMTFNNLRNYSEVYITSFSVGMNAGSSIHRGGVFTFFIQAQLDNSTELTWTKRNQYVTSIEYCQNVVPITGGTELISILAIQNFSTFQSGADLDVYIYPGFSMTCAFKPFDDLEVSPQELTAIISASASWIQR